MINQIEEDRGELPEHLPRGVSAEIAAANEDVQGIIQPRLVMLMEIADSFLLTIIDSMETVPYGIRWICKQIKSLTRVCRFCTWLGREPLSNRPLTLLSLLDCLAAAQVPGRERFRHLLAHRRLLLPPLHQPSRRHTPGVHARRRRPGQAPAADAHAHRKDAPEPRQQAVVRQGGLHDVAQPLCRQEQGPDQPVPQRPMRRRRLLRESRGERRSSCHASGRPTDFSLTLSHQLDQYLALSKKDLRINITLNELYVTQDYLQKHIDILAPSDKAHLRLCLAELGPAPGQVPRKENRAIDLPLFSRWETPVQDIATQLMSDSNVTKNDILFQETKSIFVQLLRSLPQLAERRPINLAHLAEKAATAKDAQLVRKGIKVKEMLRELEELGVLDSRDNHRLMQEEVSAELVHLGNMREKVLAETDSLDSVYKTIGDHNACVLAYARLFSAQAAS